MSRGTSLFTFYLVVVVFVLLVVSLFWLAWDGMWKISCY